jgi:hypothetical protein
VVAGFREIKELAQKNRPGARAGLGLAFGGELNGGHAHPNACFHSRGVEGRWPEMETASAT